MERRKSVYLISTPAGSTGSLEDTARVTDKIASALSRKVQKHPDWNVDAMIGMSNVSLKGGQCEVIHTGHVGRPSKIFCPNSTIEGLYYQTSPHIHIVLDAYPGETILKALKEIVTRYVDNQNRMDYKKLPEIDGAEAYVIKQSQKIRVVEAGNPECLGEEEFRFARYGRGKKSYISKNSSHV